MGIERGQTDNQPNLFAISLINSASLLFIVDSLRKVSAATIAIHFLEWPL